MEVFFRANSCCSQTSMPRPPQSFPTSSKHVSGAPLITKSLECDVRKPRSPGYGVFTCVMLMHRDLCRFSTKPNCLFMAGLLAVSAREQHDHKRNVEERDRGGGGGLAGGGVRVSKDVLGFMKVSVAPTLLSSHRKEGRTRNT